MSFLKKMTLPKSSPSSCANSPTQERDMGSSPKSRDINTNGHASKPSSGSRPETANHSRTVSPVLDPKVVAGQASLKTTTRSYKNGRTQLRKDREPSRPTTRNGSTSPDSRVQLAVPQGSRERALPPLPIFSNPIESRPWLASSFQDQGHDISPPGSSTSLRESIVLPLVQPQPHATSSGHMHTSCSHRKSHLDSVAEQEKIATESSHSSSDSQEDDGSSTYSQSSHTTGEVESPNQLLHRHGLLNAMSLQIKEEKLVGNRLPPSARPPRRYGHTMQNNRSLKQRLTCTREPARSSPNSIIPKSVLNRKSSKRNLNRPQNNISESGRLAPPRTHSESSKSPSPTLSEAEKDLHEHLASYTDHSASSTASERTMIETHSTLFTTEPTHQNILQEIVSLPPPALPPKSGKRQSTITSSVSRLSQVSAALPTSPVSHICSQKRKSTRLIIVIPDYKHDAEQAALPSTSLISGITPTSAAAVILNILHSMEHFDNLFAMAVLNRGFYRVFKRHELNLIKLTLRKMSPPAWEFREIAFPGHDTLVEEDLEMIRPEEEYTASAYLRCQKRDVQLVRAIKFQIYRKCQSFVRPEISKALASSDPAESARVDDALWRIWTFCKIFGSNKGREDDIVAQIDWLKGGPLVHQKACSFTILGTDFMNDTLISAPDCFAKGNEGGLSAGQLFDMMELWNCLVVLLQRFDGRTMQARAFGVYDNTEVRGGDIDGEELMLDEWCYYLLTLGPETVLNLVEPSLESYHSAFKLAQEKGWTKWNPPVSGATRRSFLKEAASRVYEDRIAVTYAETSTREVQRQQSRIRIQNHITELRKRKNSGERIPMIRMSQERPMSEWDTVIDNLTKPLPVPADTDFISHIPLTRSALARELERSSSTTEYSSPEPSPTPPQSEASSPPSTQSSPRRVIAMPLLPSPPPSTVPSTRDRSSVLSTTDPILAYPRGGFIPGMSSLREHPAFCLITGVSRASQFPSCNKIPQAVFAPHPAPSDIFNGPKHENTAEKAIYRIVEMGFTPDQAREALRMTDLGDSLRVDRAVELLLNKRLNKRL